MATAELMGSANAEDSGSVLIRYRSPYEIERAAKRARRRQLCARWEERMQRRLLLIVRVAADAYDIEPAALTSRTKVRDHCRSRTLYCMLARRLVRTLDSDPAPTTQIGLVIERDHSTVLHHVALGEHLLASSGRNGGEEHFRAGAAVAIEGLRQSGMMGCS